MERGENMAFWYEISKASKEVVEPAAKLDFAVEECCQTQISQRSTVN
jgi:hypothetical protein